jgi:hypothetical protein
MAHAVKPFRAVLGKPIVRWVHVILGIVIMGLLITYDNFSFLDQLRRMPMTE